MSSLLYKEGEKDPLWLHKSALGESNKKLTPFQFTSTSTTFMEKIAPIIFPSADWFIIESVLTRHYSQMPRVSFKVSGMVVLAYHRWRDRTCVRI